MRVLVYYTTGVADLRADPERNPGAELDAYHEATLTDDEKLLWNGTPDERELLVEILIDLARDRVPVPVGIQATIEDDSDVQISATADDLAAIPTSLNSRIDSLLIDIADLEQQGGTEVVLERKRQVLEILRRIKDGP